MSDTSTAGSVANASKVEAGKNVASAPNETANSAPYSGGYLSKLFGFGSSSGTSSPMVDRHSAAMDDKHDLYHPGAATS